MFSSSRIDSVAAVRKWIIQLSLLLCASVSPAHAAPGVAGSLDTTFAASSPLGAGKWRMSLANNNRGEDGSAVLVQPDGKILVAGRCMQSTNGGYCVFRLNADGTTDLSFGGGDGLRIDPTPANTSTPSPVMVLQPDGKIVLAMNCATNYYFCTTRLNADGTTDTSYGVPSSTGIGAVGWLWVRVGGANNAYAIALQPDGKILIAGLATGGASSDDFAVLRVNTNGTLDTSFAPSSPIPGTLSIPMATVVRSDIARGVMVQSDGKIVVTGHCGAISMFCALRLNADGTVDNSYGVTGDGKVFVRVTPTASSDEYAYAAAMQADGKIVMGGACYGFPGNTPRGFCALRLNTDGTPDTSFSGDGKLLEPILDGLHYVYDLKIQADGKIVLAGQCRTISGGDDQFCAMRLHVDGTLDASFGGDGKVVESFSSGSDAARALAIQPDGKLVLAGDCATGTYDEFCVMRLDTDCRLDLDASNTTSADVDGVILVRSMLGFKDAALTSGISASVGAKRTVAQAASYRNYCKAAAAPLCNGDIDGDGSQAATIDALIAIRAMLGLTGDAVVGGINFPVSATRTTWTPIRDHLVTQCGMSLPL